MKKTILTLAIVAISATVPLALTLKLKYHLMKIIDTYRQIIISILSPLNPLKIYEKFGCATKIT